MKQREDKGAHPTKKSEMMELYEKWKDRNPPVFEYENDELLISMPKGENNETNNGIFSHNNEFVNEVMV